MGGMAVEKWTPERRRQLTRDALLDAAANVFAQRGFHGASLDDIAETAGFTRSAIYKNFGGKEDLFLAVMTRLNERSLRDFEELLPSGHAFDPEFAAHAVTQKWREIMTPPELVALELEFNLYVLRNPDLRERVVAQRRTSRDMVARFMERQARASDVKLAVPIEDLASMFLTAADGFAIAAAVDPEKAHLFEPFLELLLAAMTAPAPRYYAHAEATPATEE
jgi:AcrR family transcriptional regulator